MSRQRRKHIAQEIWRQANETHRFQRALFDGFPVKAALACSWGDSATRFGRYWYDSKPWWRRLLWRLRLLQVLQWLEWQWLKLRRKVAEFGYSDTFRFSVEGA